ncbi:MAG: hypothetical protein M3Z29_12995, partial [Pseudomonadota bacterium]|nr:hypothetical protein [Pseudomonadota bacterium]
RRLAALLQMPLEPAAERWHARQKLQLGVADLPACDEPPRVALALGGVRIERTYRHWPDVAQALCGAGHTRFALVGSDNGAAMAAAVKAAIGSADVLDLVATTDLHGSQQAMARCALVVCADGGLLHLACTTSRSILALFDSSIDPAWRLPIDATVTALRADVRDVSAIAPATVAAAAMAMLGRPHAGGGNSQQDDVVLLR